MKFTTKKSCVYRDDASVDKLKNELTKQHFIWAQDYIDQMVDYLVKQARNHPRTDTQTLNITLDFEPDFHPDLTVT